MRATTTSMGPDRVALIGPPRVAGGACYRRPGVSDGQCSCAGTRPEQKSSGPWETRETYAWVSLLTNMKTHLSSRKRSGQACTGCRRAGLPGKHGTDSRPGTCPRSIRTRASSRAGFLLPRQAVRDGQALDPRQGLAIAQRPALRVDVPERLAGSLAADAGTGVAHVPQTRGAGSAHGINRGYTGLQVGNSLAHERESCKPDADLLGGLMWSQTRLLYRRRALP